MRRILNSIIASALPGHAQTPNVNGQKARGCLFEPSGHLNNGSSESNLFGLNVSGDIHSLLFA